MMDERFALKSFQMLRLHREAMAPRESKSLVPVGYVSWVARNLNIKWWSVLLYIADGRLTVARSGGERKSRLGVVTLTRAEFERAFATRSDAAQIFTIQFSDGTRPRHGLSKSYGFLVLGREQRFDPRERTLLKEIANLLGSFIAFRDQMFRLRQISEARIRLEAVIASEGTFANKMQAATYILGKAAGAAFGGFAVVVEDVALPEFFYRPNSGHTRFGTGWKLLGIDTSVKLPSGLVAELISGKPVLRTNLGDDEELFNAYRTSEFDAIGHADFIRVLAPVVIDRQLIGVFTYAVSRFVPWFEEGEIAQILARAPEGLWRQSIYTFQRRAKKLIVDPIFRGRETRVESDLAFVLMPFSEDWSDRIWTRLIKPVCAAAGLRAIRADDLYGRDIMEDVWASICRARVVIADITGRNPNVFYELGLAHTLGKSVVLLTQNKVDIPFDLNRFRHIIYSDNMDGYDVLDRELAATLQEMLRTA